jgi:outer membrane usher protein
MLWRVLPAHRSARWLASLVTSLSALVMSLAGFGAYAQPNHDLGGVYSNLSTAKSDKLMVDPQPIRSFAPPTPQQPPIRIETVKGVFVGPDQPTFAPPTSSAVAVAPQNDAEPTSSQPTPPGAASSAAAFWANASRADAAPEERQINWSKKGSGNASDRPTRNMESSALAGFTDIALPVKDGKFLLGQIAARIVGESEPQLEKEGLGRVLKPILDPLFVQKIEWAPDQAGYVSLDALRGAGLITEFDKTRLDLAVSPTVDQRIRGKLSADHALTVPRGETISPPAALAGYLNTRVGLGYQSEPFEDEGEGSARLSLDGAVRWHDIVFESAGSFAGDDGYFVRGASRFIYDLPEDAVRVSIGDVLTPTAEHQSSASLLGISIEKTYGKLQPSKEVRPTGSRSFRIESISSVDVVINGSVIQRFNLRPGNYDLDDLPLTVGANDIELVIEDDVGRRRTIEFNLFSSRTLLAPDISEWALSAGVASRYGSQRSDLHNLFGDQIYAPATPIVTGSYDRGLTADITGSVHFQSDVETIVGGVGAAMQTSFGFWTLDAGMSRSLGYELGYSVDVGYELLNLKDDEWRPRSLRLAADYISSHFAAIGVAEPFNPAMINVSAVYSQGLPWDLSGSIAGVYSVGRRDHQDSYSLDLSLNRAFGPDINAALSASFEQTLGKGVADNDGDSFVAALRLSYRLDQQSGIDLSNEISGDGGRSRVGYRRQEGSGVGSWNVAVDLDRDGPIGGTQGGRYDVNASLGYLANRAELALSQHTGLIGADSDRFKQRTNITAATAIAFADNEIAVGRPISNGFAIIAPHSNLTGSSIAVGGPRESARSISDDMGPALVTDLSAYSRTQIPYDVSDLPVGYDLGAGAFELSPAYRSGYRLTVGSDYTISASGSLIDKFDQPVALLAGTAHEADRQDGPKVTVFTNSAGRFAAQGLKPGRWVLEMEADPLMRFVLDIPVDAVGLVSLGILRQEPTQ